MNLDGLAPVSGYEPRLVRTLDSVRQSIAEGIPVLIRVHSAADYPCEHFNDGYCLPIAFFGGENNIYRTILVNINTKSMRPSKAIINEFYKEVKEISPYHSGAALSSMTLKEYGKNVSQSEF